MKLAEAMNTYDPALLVMRTLGYALSYEPPTTPDGFPTWVAARGDVTLYASDPLALLGLVALREHRGERWQLQPGEDKLYDALRVTSADSRHPTP